jgi:bifunctional non-homologous end joining protein LigD
MPPPGPPAPAASAVPASLPRHLAPMLAVAAPELPFDQGRWGFELKWDGVRAVAHGDGPAATGHLRLEGRSLRDVTATYPELAPVGRVLRAAGAVVDGEVVALDAGGRPDFQRLQERMGVTDRRVAVERAARVPTVYLVFDVLQVGGRPLIDRTYVERRALLGQLGLSGAGFATPPWFPGEGAATLQAARERKLEGVVAKRLDSPYLPGARSRLWRKVKFVHREEFVVGGWLPGEGARSGRIGSLLLGRHDADGPLRFCGAVGTGFTGAELERLQARLSPGRRRTSPFVGTQPRRGAVFVEPDLVVEVEFREVTRDGILRAPSYKGMRLDKSPRDVSNGGHVEMGGGDQR